MQIRVLSEPELRRMVDMPAAIAAMRSAFAGLSDGSARIPVRTAVEAGPTTLLVMPGWLPAAGALGAKLVTVGAGDRERGLPPIQAAVLLVDPRTGTPVALLAGTWLTALRTGAASGLATDLLARADARVLAVIGAGAQARTQIAAVRAVRALTEIRVSSRTRASAEALARELASPEASAPGPGGADVQRPPRVVVADAAASAVRGADVIVTATDSVQPVLDDADVSPGAHVNAVGAYRPDMRELPGELVGRARVVVDQVEAALEEAGDVVIPLVEGRIDRASLTELGDLVLGRAVARRSPEEVTVFKSVGSAAQDLALAALALARAEAAGGGTLVSF